jgi:hypothetical protein
MGFDPWNFSLKIQKSIKTTPPKVGVHLEYEGSFPHTLPHSGSMKCDSRVSFLVRTFASPYFGRKLNVRIVTPIEFNILLL